MLFWSLMIAFGVVWAIAAAIEVIWFWGPSEEEEASESAPGKSASLEKASPSQQGEKCEGVLETRVS